VHHRFSVAAPAGRVLPLDAVSYGADVPGETELRLLGNVEGKRVLDLGCGAGHNEIALAKQGAKVIGVDPSADQIAEARQEAEAAGVKVELHHGSLAEVAFVRADGIDVALSVFGLATVSDVDRVFRQVHRVLKPEAPLVLALPHPAFALIDPEDPELRVRRSYWETAAILTSGAEDGDVDQPHTVSQLFTSLLRANFRIDWIIEPQPAANTPRGPHWTPAMTMIPATLIIRARKQGI
jgi:SAM-dependent methyltransferase